MRLLIETADGQTHVVELSAPLRDLVGTIDAHVAEQVGFDVLARADELLGTPAETKP